MIELTEDYIEGFWDSENFLEPKEGKSEAYYRGYKSATKRLENENVTTD
jgi:hypothetical protein